MIYDIIIIVTTNLQAHKWKICTNIACDFLKYITFRNIIQHILQIKNSGLRKSRKPLVYCIFWS